MKAPTEKILSMLHSVIAACDDSYALPPANSITALGDDNAALLRQMESYGLVAHDGTCSRTPWSVTTHGAITAWRVSRGMTVDVAPHNRTTRDEPSYDDLPIGEVSDAAIAHVMGCGRLAAGNARRRRRIPACRPDRRHLRVDPDTLDVYDPRDRDE